MTEPCPDTDASTGPSPRTSVDPAVDLFVETDADADRVWRALTTEHGLAPWMGEGASVEACPGGAVVLPDPVGGVTRRGRVERVDEGRRLDFTWWPALRPAERTTVSITVEPLDGRSGSKVRVVERRPMPTTASAASTTAVAATSVAATAGPSPRAGTGRLAVGLWSWRLAVLSVGVCLSRL